MKLNQGTLAMMEGSGNKHSWIYLVPLFASTGFGFFALFGVPSGLGLSISAAHTGFWVCLVLSCCLLPD